MRREKAQVAQTARPKVPMRPLGADCSVVVLKRGNARGAKGAGHRHLLGSTGNGRNPMFNGRRQPSCDGTSRMTRECQVRFCERLGVQFPGPTRHPRKLPSRPLCQLSPATDITAHEALFARNPGNEDNRGRQAHIPTLKPIAMAGTDESSRATDAGYRVWAQNHCSRRLALSLHPRSKRTT
jgi:hypothetical protein